MMQCVSLLLEEAFSLLSVLRYDKMHIQYKSPKILLMSVKHSEKKMSTGMILKS